MTPGELLAELGRRRIELTRDGDRLRYRAPDGALTKELRAALVQAKPWLLTHLLHQAITDGPGSPPESKQPLLPLDVVAERLRETGVLWSLRYAFYGGVVGRLLADVESAIGPVDVIAVRDRQKRRRPAATASERQQRESL